MFSSSSLCAAGFFQAFKDAVNYLTQPAWFVTLVVVALAALLLTYRRWTRPRVAAALLGVFCLFYFGSLADPNFRRTVTKPDNVPITMMVLGVMFFLWLALRRAAANDASLAAGKPLPVEDADDKVLVWPDLVYIELIAMVIATAALTAWAILAKAPLEQPASPDHAPNPAKAPWYFLGLQEMLVYFDPWMAGVVYPGLIIIGLMAIPYIDTNPRGGGYYTLRQRPFAVGTFLFGFLILWVVPIFFGTFLRGPNWSFFGLYQPWDPHKAEALNNINVSDVWWTHILDRPLPAEGRNPVPWLPVWLVREWVGLLLLALYLFLTPAVLKRTVFRRACQSMSAMRYAVMVLLLLMMALMPIKMALRWGFNLKYFVYLPEFSANL